MIRCFRLAVLIVGASMVGFAQSQSSTDVEALKTVLKSSSNLSGDFAAVRKRMAKIFQLRKSVKPEVADALVCAAASGLVAIGDAETYAKVRNFLQDQASFDIAISTDCTRCGGAGHSSVKCLKCGGSGKCPISSCEDGMIQQVQLSGPPLAKKCSFCVGTGLCRHCKGKGIFEVACPVCKGKGCHIDKEKARDYYEICIANALNMIANETPMSKVTGMPDVFNVKDDEKGGGGGGGGGDGDVPTYWSSFAPTVLSDREGLSHFFQGISRNASGISKKFKAYEFNFELYRQWKNEGATEIQKQKVLENLFSKGLKSGFYKDFVRCYFALVPDGLSFAVIDVNAWKETGYKYNTCSKGPKLYCVTLELLSNGNYYNTGSSSAKWTGEPWQNDDFATFLSEEALLPGYELSLLVPIRDENVETWTKGKILISKGWIYDVQIWHGMGQTESGNIMEVAEIHSLSTYVFRSIAERMELENEFDYED